MAAPELRLNVTLDLVGFRTQLKKLTEVAAGREAVIKVNDSQVAAANIRLKNLTEKLATLRKAAASPIVVEIQYKSTGDVPAARTRAKAAVSTAVRGQELVSGASYKDLQQLYKFAEAAGLEIEKLKRGAASSTVELQRVLGAAFNNVGQSVKDGIKNGLADADSELSKIAAGMSEALINTTKKTLGIASPSTVYKRLAQFCVQGFAKQYIDDFGKFQSRAVAQFRKFVAQIRKLTDVFESKTGKQAQGGGGLRGRTINFSTNISKVEQDLLNLQRKLTQFTTKNPVIEIDLNSSQLANSIDKTFKQLDKEIRKQQKALRKTQIGSGEFEARASLVGRAEGLQERGRYMAEVFQLRTQAEAFEPGSLVRTQKAIEALRIQASQIAPNTKDWVDFQRLIGRSTLELQRAEQAAESIQLTSQLGALAPGSLAQLETKLILLRNSAREIKPDTKEWRNLNKEIQQLERGIEKSTRRPTTMRQRAGAAGGAFLYGGGLGGGLGSALGGVAGGFLGGPPGAFAGAAVGQLADNLARSLAGITSQATAVVQLQRGLALASEDAADFAKAQEAVAGISQRLLMPLEDATRYFTQLRANTREYNMTVAETAMIMEGTASAIAATGGSSEDLSGAMRAVVQIMSKGGVQAEELRGQLGERFPGAVVKFAKANKMSFEELQNAFQRGEVSIRKFVEFAKANYADYGKFTEKLATAPEYAGKRLQIALEGLQREIGGLFAPVGAEIQDVLTETINNIAGFIKENRAYLRQMIKDFASIVGPIAKIFGQLLEVIGNFSVAVGKVFQDLFSVIRQSLGMANIAEAKARLDKAAKAVEGKEKPTGTVRGGRGGGPWREYEQAKKAYKDLGGDAAFKQAQAPLQPEGLIFGGPGAGMSIDLNGQGAGTAGTGASGGATRESRIPALQEELNLARQLLAIDQQITMAELGGNDLAVIRLNGLKEQLRIQSEIAQVRLQKDVPVAEQQLQIAKLLVDADKSRMETTAKLQQSITSQLQSVQEAMTRIATTAKEELEDKRQYNRLITEGMEPALAKITVEVQRQFSIEVERLKRIAKQISEEIRLLKEKEKQTAEDEIQLKILEKKLRLAQQGIESAPEQAQDVISSRYQTFQLDNQPKSALETIKDAAKAAKDELDKLTSSGNIAVTAANAIGDSFGNAFKGLISGSMSAGQALKSFFQGVADAFLDMAAQIIAKWLVMTVLNSILKLFPGGGSGGFDVGGSSGGFDLPGFQMPDYMGGVTIPPAGSFAKGGAFGKNGIVPFATGGIVNSPTLFPFADGGAMRTGLMGEAGPEAIMPLRRGPGGRLGVEAVGAFAANRQAMAGMPSGASSGAFEANRSVLSTTDGIARERAAERAMTATLDAPPQPLNIKYESQVINNVEYVSAEQFQRGMSDAAERGRALTISALKNSVKARRQVGM